MANIEMTESRRVWVAFCSAGLIFVALVLVILAAGRVAPQSIVITAVISAASVAILALPAIYYFLVAPGARGSQTEGQPQQRAEPVGQSIESLRGQRLESIGLLAGGIAHDLNNVLTPIMMAVDLLKPTATDDQQSLLETIEANALRGAGMVRGVLSFARGLEGPRMDMQVRHLMREIDGIARETFPKNIIVHVSAARNLWTVTGDPTQLHQVLLNLCINARDAMPEGGRISITARNVSLEAADKGAAARPYVLIQINDQGTGIPASIIDRIFDPFFTTKGAGKGTGLGLSTSLTIVKNHGGFMRVTSPPGSGAQFEIYLPAVPEGVDAGSGPARSLCDVRGGAA